MNTKPELPGQLTERLLEYWVDHPEAQSTVESIAEWWLLEQHIQHTVGDVESVLAELVERDFVEQLENGDGRAIYRLNAARVSEIRGWIESRFQVRRETGFGSGG